MSPRRLLLGPAFALLCSSFVLACADESATDDVGEVSSAPGSEPAVVASGETASESVVADVTAGGVTATAADESASPVAAVADAPPPRAPSPKPTKACAVEKDAEGFFSRTSSKSPYVAYVPKSYTGDAAVPVIVGLHGCGDDAKNFAKWGINPWDTRATQQYIGLSVGGETGNNKCWNMSADGDKVMAAVDDIASCFWVDRDRVVVAGFSSGGQLAYRVGLQQASSFAGILIENSGLHAAGLPADQLLAGASWKIPVAHRARTGDSVFPLAKVQADWSKIDGSGFPLETSVLAGGHDGDGKDWSQWLLPRAAAWIRP